jgi:hypothetical protein
LALKNVVLSLFPFVSQPMTNRIKKYTKRMAG